MKIYISKAERDILLNWYEGTKSQAGRYGDGDGAFPDEERLISLINVHNAGFLEVGFNNVIMLQSWAESNADRTFGRGSITNPLEHSLLQKFSEAYEAMKAAQGPVPEKEIGSGIAKNIPQSRIASPPKQGSNKLIISGLVAITIVLIGIIVLLSGPEKTHVEEKVQVKTEEIDPTFTYRVVYQMGDVFKKVGEKWKKISLGSPLISGDSIKTGPESQVVIRCSEFQIPMNENQKIRVK